MHLRYVSMFAGISILAACSPPRIQHFPEPVPAPIQEDTVTVIEAPDTLDAGPSLENEEFKPATERNVLGNVAYDLPVEANTWVEEELDYLVNQRHSVVERWLKRAVPYEAFVKQVFTAHGIPTDLYHLGLIESGFVPRARSHAGAVGIWQFMPATGREAGLRVDDVVDERMDPVRSTYAAARHLRSLSRSFNGDWALAAAAYNAGTGRISRGLRETGAKDFWQLALWGTLANETKQYVPRLYAVTILGRDPERFGFQLPRAAQPFSYDSVQTDLAIPLKELAGMGGLQEKALEEMNPHLFRGVTPEGNYWVWAPAGVGSRLQQAYMNSQFRKDGGYGTYVVREGDTAEKLAKYAKIETDRIERLNPSISLNRLIAGQRLRLPKRIAEKLSARPIEKRSAKTHKVKSGETLSGLAAKYDVSVREIKAANGLKNDVIRVGQKLRIPGGKGNDEQEDSNHDEGVNFSGEYEIKSGDTLSQIAEKFGTSVSALRKANSLGADDPIIAGKKIRVPSLDSEEPGKKTKDKGDKKEKDAKGKKQDSERATTHEVKSGDTLSEIAEKFGTTVTALREANGLGDNSTIKIGQTLVIPGSAAETKSKTDKVEPRLIEYIVKSGDTLWGIAEKHNTTVAAIKEENKLGKEGKILPGQALLIPREK